MNKNTSNTTHTGIGFLDLLTIVFITLKLLGKIDWPWIWVLSPAWIGFLIGVLIIGIVVKLVK